MIQCRYGTPPAMEMMMRTIVVSQSDLDAMNAACHLGAVLIEERVKNGAPWIKDHADLKRAAKLISEIWVATMSGQKVAIVNEAAPTEDA